MNKRRRKKYKNKMESILKDKEKLICDIVKWQKIIGEDFPFIESVAKYYEALIYKNSPKLIIKEKK